MRDNKPFETNYFLDYYKNYRNNKEDLFDSEKYFFEKLDFHKKNILDVGCAKGGLYKMISDIESEFEYTGIDFSAKMIEAAKDQNQGVQFLQKDAKKTGFKNNSFDIVIALGVFVHEKDWVALLKELYRITKKQLFFDIRLTNYKTVNDVKKSYVLDGAKIRYPYVIINKDDFNSKLKSSLLLSKKINEYGYNGKPNEFVICGKEYENIEIKTFLINK